MAAQWYARMADIPGLAFAGGPDVSRSRLAGARLRPRTEYGELMWPMPGGGSTTATPAQTHAGATDLSDLTVPALVRYTWEGLEYPGEPIDYHFIMQAAVEELWRRRRQDPDALGHLETFALLDIALAEATPDAVSFTDAPGERTFVHMSTFIRLLTMYVREGAHRDALDLARRGQRLGQVGDLDEFEARVAALDAETPL